MQRPQEENEGAVFKKQKAASAAGVARVTGQSVGRQRLVTEGIVHVMRSLDSGSHQRVDSRREGE